MAGRPTSPVWPEHWAASTEAARFQYSPRSLASSRGRPPITLLYSDPSHERMALFVQQQLQAVGVAVQPELSSVSEAMTRAAAGDFDTWLADMGLGPNFLRQYLFWHSGSPYNWGNYSSRASRRRAGCHPPGSRRQRLQSGRRRNFNEPMIQDPPALFLAWSERARAVSTRFEVPAEPGRDMWSTLALWRPVAASAAAQN